MLLITSADIYWHTQCMFAKNIDVKLHSYLKCIINTYKINVVEYNFSTEKQNKLPGVQN